MLAIQGLTAGYAAQPVLHGIDLAVNDGEAVAVVGANGAGKTALVRALAGLMRPVAGTIAKDGVDITHMPGHLRSRHGIAVVPENRNLFPDLNVLDTLRLAQRAGRCMRIDGERFSMDDVLQLFPPLAERRGTPVGLLSGGQQQMVAIARALLLQPDLLVLDELTTGLAPVIVKDMLAVLAALRRRGMSVVLVEQSIAVASATTERAYVLAVGRVVHEVPPGGWPAALADRTLVKAYLHG